MNLYKGYRDTVSRIGETEMTTVEKTYIYHMRENGYKYPCAFVDHTSDGKAIYRDPIGRHIVMSRDEAHTMAKTRSRFETYGVR